MRKPLLVAAISCLLFSSCQDHEHHDKPCLEIHKYTPSHHMQEQDSTYCEYIPVDSANEMIESYLISINGQQASTKDLHSLIYSADSLRAFLDNNPTITNVKFMFAHTLDYINSGGYGKYAGYQSGALTLVLAGYDPQGNYVYYTYPQTQCPMVKDHCMPCPNYCPPQGTASSDTLPVQPSKRK